MGAMCVESGKSQYYRKPDHKKGINGGYGKYDTNHFSHNNNAHNGGNN